MIKDTGNLKKKVMVPVNKGHTKKNPLNKTVGREGSGKGSVSGDVDASKKGKPVSRKILLKAAIALFLLLIAAMFYMRDSKPVLLQKTEIVRRDEAGMISAETVNRVDDASIAKKSDIKAFSAPIISAVRIIPSQPLPTDGIKAEPVLAGADATGVVFSYRWKVNGLFVEGKVTDTLSGVVLKRRDSVSVVVSAMRDGLEGPATESPTVLIHSLPPLLEMKIVTERYRPGDTVEIQLLGTAPDGDHLVFSLVSPFIDGMKIDGKSGRIVWKPERLLPGKLQFGASAEDTDGNKTVKVFQIDLGIGGML